MPVVAEIPSQFVKDTAAALQASSDAGRSLARNRSVVVTAPTAEPAPKAKASRKPAPVDTQE